MDSLKRALPQAQGSPRRNPRAMEGDENATPRRPVAAGSASPQRKKVLGERNGAGRGEGAASPAKAALTPPPSTGGGAGTYDPKTNYTTPRPDFLRYDPKRSREIILRLGREVEGDSSSATSGTELSEVLSSGSSAARGSDSECDDADEEEVVPAQGRGGRWARRLLLLLLSSACLFCYIYFPLLGPIQYEHEADIDQTVVGDSEDGILLHGPGASPSNFMAVAMMGMADDCPNVAFGEFTCQIGDESSEILDVLNEDSGIGELKSEASMRPLENAEENSEVVCSGGDVTAAPFGSTHSDDLDEDRLGLVPQETGEDDSEHSMPQSVTMDEILESESLKVVSDDKGLESEKLDQEFNSLEYENTAKAAKKLVDMVKILWAAVEPHLLKMLACLSVAGLVTVMFKYSQRSRKVKVPVSQRMPSVPTRRVPVLAPHNTVPLPVFHSEQPVQRIVPKQESSACLELPLQSLLSESDQSVCLNVPSIGHRDHDQKVQQEDGGGIERASDGSTMDQKDTDRSKPPVVQLLGEFSFVDADSSRRRPVKDSIQHGGDVTVQESVSSRKRVVKTQKDSDKMQTPGLQTARKKETTRAEEEKVDATPTPRRSNRLRKLASP
ncbi:hypothetical protein CFC21_042321 [Triticum aestivum]|uniref:Uncharacterized protein n=3 Tax=Triticum TaxID=4564 RepID=A0A9R1S4Q5_TRITD|nr:uncharacterized protein LOC123070889 isoform X2 [Triticum aestivum]KAF7030882.1 hypothetical protein CFC21_042321 [Triticum aestivum]VAH80092.1 unnamed protein product [Triticum turgidum subsp. durum]